MLQVARLSPRLLGDAAGLVAGFLQSQLNNDGGFRNRAGASDLYYTVFGLEGLAALQAEAPLELAAGYVRGFGDGEGLDFVHLSCLARAWANLPRPLLSQAPRQQILRRIEKCRTPDGGFNLEPNRESGTAYACFLAVGAYQDLGMEPPEPERILDCIAGLRAADSGYANQSGMPMGLTPSTAAVAALRRNLGAPSEPEIAEWILERQHPDGGFYATPLAPIPDLLSTATALHALSGLHADIDAVRDSCLDFVDSLWVNRGAFYGSWSDDFADCEYTYYGLLALGHLSV